MKLLCIHIMSFDTSGKEEYDVIEVPDGCVPRTGDNIDFSRKPCPKVRQVIWFPSRISLANIGHEHTEADVILLCE